MDIPSPILFIPCGGIACCPCSRIWDPCSSLHPCLPLCLLVLTTDNRRAQSRKVFFLFVVPRRGRPTGLRTQVRGGVGAPPRRKQARSPGRRCPHPAAPRWPVLPVTGLARVCIRSSALPAGACRSPASPWLVWDRGRGRSICAILPASLCIPDSEPRAGELLVPCLRTFHSFSLPDCLQRTDFFIFRNVSLILQNWTFAINQE